MHIDQIIKLRQTIHQNPEISNHEYDTAKRIAQFFKPLSPTEELDLSKTGKAFVFDSGVAGKTLMFRAELDALPIQETSEVPYRSTKDKVAHACGHDGHMAIVAGLAAQIAQNPPQKGKVVMLFQPAEEVEQGARDVVNDPVFQSIQPDFIFGLHNIPGAPKHEIILKKGTFAAASKGMTVKLHGKTSHAAEPENGISPSIAIAKIITALNELIQNQDQFTDLVLLTIIHVKMGEIAFGTSPGYAEVRATLRAYENEDMKKLTAQTEEIIHAISREEKLGVEISYNEVFPAVENNNEALSMVEASAKAHQLSISIRDKPFKWSEDFSYFTEKYKGCFFGLGAGTNQAQLHHSDYDFPDEILETGIQVFFEIYRKINL
ncbi:amidohydrolase [Mongoliitalea lutea]|uniref:Peptidase M20 n=1 Tax=Mongoliitalea lutea TaxID=849756 RepID=A0A8J3G499_9BACT|nr:amidohydrolase [Mongoliitalea lutea]GHB28010.1 peptidase M20 [Mongoliitalea lutea]